jgi:hypothetical protein
MTHAELSPGAVGGIAAAVLVPIVMRWLARAFPYQAPHVSADLSREELARRYARWESFLWAGLFLGLARLAYASFRDDSFFLPPTMAFWFLPAIFLGILTGGALTHLLYARLLGDRYAEYTLYANLRAGFDTWRVGRVLAAGMILLSAVAVPMGLDCYTRFTDEAVHVNTFFSLGERRDPYADATEIRRIATFRAPNGNVIARPYFVLIFQDGSRWSSRDGLHDDDAKRDQAILAFVSRRSGKPVSEYEIAPEQR